MDITLRHVWRSFGEKQVLRDFSHTFPQGELTVVMGPSGCGKTTLLSLLLGLQAPDRGEILGLEGLKKSAVFQEDRLCENTTAQANLRLVNPSLTREQANQALTALGLGDSLSQPVREFSGGMKRRVAILRALLAPYDVLLCDEPFQGEDPGQDGDPGHPRRKRGGIFRRAPFALVNRAILVYHKRTGPRAHITSKERSP